LSEIDNF